MKNYLNHVSRLGTRWVLPRNSREGKQLRKTGSVDVASPILGNDYLAMLPGYEVMARDMHTFGYRSVDGHHSELLLLRRTA